MDIILYILSVVVTLIGALVLRVGYKYYATLKVVKAYPPFGGCSVKIVFSHDLPEMKGGKGVFDPREKEIRVALHNPLNKVLENYLHERRHSEQRFSGNEELLVMFATSNRKLAQAERNIKGDDFLYEVYFNSPHEVDARAWAEKEIKGYLNK